MTEDDESHDRAEEWEPDDADRSDEPAEAPCPYCKREISEEAVQCPYCGCYLSAEDTPRQPKPWWWIVGIVLVVLLLLVVGVRAEVVVHC
jgi:hypothetical protein